MAAQALGGVFSPVIELGRQIPSTTDNFRHFSKVLIGASLFNEYAAGATLATLAPSEFRTMLGVVNVCWICKEATKGVQYLTTMDNGWAKEARGAFSSRNSSSIVDFCCKITDHSADILLTLEYSVGFGLLTLGKAAREIGSARTIGDWVMPAITNVAIATLSASVLNDLVRLYNGTNGNDESVQKRLTLISIVYRVSIVGVLLTGQSYGLPGKALGAIVTGSLGVWCATEHSLAKSAKKTAAAS